MTVEKLKKYQKGNKIYSLIHFPGDDKYVINSLDANIKNKVQSAKEVAVFDDKKKALDFWDNEVEGS